MWTCPRCGRIGFVDAGGDPRLADRRRGGSYRHRVDAAAALVDLFERGSRQGPRASDPPGADLAEREISTCSQGERGRIRIARALIADPELLLLDEPAVGLDLAAREALIAALDRLSEEKPGLTTVLVTHHLEEIPASSTHAILLRDGQALAVGAIESTLTNANLSACFGLPVDCRHDGQRWSARAPANWSRSSAARSG